MRKRRTVAGNEAVRRALREQLTQYEPLLRLAKSMPRPLDPAIQGALASHDMLKKRLAFEEAMCATSLGQKSWELRQQAIELIGAGRKEEAFQLYERAASLHAESDNSPAAVMCR